MTFGVLAWVVSWEFSDWPLPFDVGVLVEGLFFWLTFYLFLAFPMGRVEPAAARWLMGALALGVVAFFLPWALFSPVIAGGGPSTGCAPNCPENVLQLGLAPGLVEAAGKAETYAALTITLVVLVVYMMRLGAASRPQRRSLTAVAVTPLLFLPAYFAFNFSAWILHLDQATLDTLAWFIVGARVLLPLGFLIALLRAQLAQHRSGGMRRSPRRSTMPHCGSATSTRKRKDLESEGAQISPRPRVRVRHGCRSAEVAGRWRRW